MISKMGAWTGLTIFSCSAVAFAVSESMPGGGAGECVVQTLNGRACDGVSLNTISRLCGPNESLEWENCRDLVFVNDVVYGAKSSDCGAADYSTESKLCAYRIGTCIQFEGMGFCRYPTNATTRNRQSTTNFHGDCFPCS